MSTRAEDQPLFPYGEVDPDEHPDWRAAREYGIDMALLAARLRMTPHQRVLRLQAMQRLHQKLHAKAWAVRRLR
ncbi:MAG TPA: hypothetical protein VG755_11750 [Nannocystaceae bacterium]|nr:hypothetical protein [Nannocystaceae bacterium]